MHKRNIAKAMSHLMTDDVFTELITVKVGPEVNEKTFYVHKALAEHQYGYFRGGNFLRKA
ncbi:hypothetical protein P280DRAFT_467769 [Massarina eburnea CBS 473.64]|uniref:Uncharacterized protein n=1 Tax=Massarina eburnea CBS 473.64 TaxID=1395130 RepID=A0A6A6S7L9_9PLEO|nr:hypothetical protein P280DRAFT_467769 [Massarina eburnea CBS 473.64]